MANPFDQFDTGPAQSGADATNNVGDAGQQKLQALPDDPKGQSDAPAGAPQKGQNNPFDQFDMAPDQNQNNAGQNQRHDKSSSSDVVNDSTSFVKSPTWKNLGNAAKEALSDTYHTVTDPVAHIGKMVYGSDDPNALIGPSEPIVTKSVPQTLGNVADLVLPFVGNGMVGAAPEEGAAAFGPEAAAVRPNNVQNQVGRQITAPQMRRVASSTFDAADKAGGALPVEHTDTLISTIKDQADQSKAVDTLFGKNQFSDLAENAEKLRGKPLTFKDATDLDKQLTQKIRAEVNPDGTQTADGQKFIEIQDQLHDLMESPIASYTGPGFALQNTAKKMWATQARANTINDIISKARTMQQPATALQTGMRQLANNGRRMQGYTPEQRQAIQQMSQNPGMTRELLRAGSSRLLGIFGIAHGPVSGIATQIGRSAATKLGEHMAFAPARGLQSDILNNVELPDLRNFQAKGGRVKSHSGKVVKKPVSYPALEAMRKRP